MRAVSTDVREDVLEVRLGEVVVVRELGLWDVVYSTVAGGLDHRGKDAVGVRRRPVAVRR